MSGYYFGVGALLVFWIMSYRITDNWEPWALTISEGSKKDKNGEKNKDKNREKKGGLSASKFQALLWTLIVLFSYSSVFGARFLDSAAEALRLLPMIPLNLFLLMGFSITTAVGSKGVTISYKTQGIISQKSGGLMRNPKGQGDLQKTQMLAWTVVAAFIYLMKVVAFISNKTYTQLDVAALPDVDQTLLLLMGVSQGSYLGNKVVSKDVAQVPKINEIVPLKGPMNTLVTILGENFGDPHEDNFVTMQGSIIRKDEVGFWNDKQIRVQILDKFQKGDKINLGVYCFNNSSNKVTFEVT